MSFVLLGILNSQAAGAVGAGSYDLLETTVLTSSASSVSFTGLGAYTDYKHLQVRFTVHSTGSTSLEMQMNGDTGSNYSYHKLQGTGSTVRSDDGFNVSSTEVGYASTTTSAFAGGVLDILDFSNSSKNPTIRSLSGTGAERIFLFSGARYNTEAVTSLLFKTSSGNIDTGSRFSLYGIKG